MPRVDCEQAETGPIFGPGHGVYRARVAGSLSRRVKRTRTEDASVLHRDEDLRVLEPASDVHELLEVTIERVLAGRAARATMLLESQPEHACDLLELRLVRLVDEPNNDG